MLEDDLGFRALGFQGVGFRRKLWAFMGFSMILCLWLESSSPWNCSVWDFLLCMRGLLLGGLRAVWAGFACQIQRGTSRGRDVAAVLYESLTMLW